MKIKKPKTTISNFEFSDPNKADTVAFFDPSIKDDRGGFAVVQKEDAQLIQAAEEMRELVIKYHDLITAINSTEGIKRRLPAETVELFDKEMKNIEAALKKAGCEIIIE